MKITLYANYGVLAHEKQTLYSLAPYAEINEKLTVEIPAELSPRYNDHEILFVTIPDYGETPFVDVLGTFGGEPAIRWYDAKDNLHHRTLKEII